MSHYHIDQKIVESFIVENHINVYGPCDDEFPDVLLTIDALKSVSMTVEQAKALWSDLGCVLQSYERSLKDAEK